MAVKPLIKARWAIAQNEGGCTACGTRLRVKQITVGNEHFTQSFRLCDECVTKLIEVLKDAN